MATTKNSGTAQAEEFIKNTFNTFSQSMDAVSSFTKDSVDAIVKSSSKSTKNFEAIFSEVLNCTKANIEECVSSAKDLAGARSIEQVIAIQTEQSKKCFENYVSQMTKISELCMNFSKDATAPVAQQATAFSEKFMKKAA
jgi:phasin family protein